MVANTPVLIDAAMAERVVTAITGVDDELTDLDVADGAGYHGQCLSSHGSTM